MTTTEKRLSQHQLEMLLWITEHPLCTTREVADGLGITMSAIAKRLDTALAHGLIARQPPLGYRGLPVAYRWQVVPL